MQHPVRDFNSINRMIPQSQFNERSKNQIKSNKEIPSSPAASSLLPLPTQPAALESIKEIGAEQLCPYTAKHEVKHMKYATHSAFALLFSLTRWKWQWQAQREASSDVQHLLQSALTRASQQPLHSHGLHSSTSPAGLARSVRGLVRSAAELPSPQRHCGHQQSQANFTRQ